MRFFDCCFYFLFVSRGVIVGHEKEIKVNTFNVSSNIIALYQDASSQGLLEISSVNSSGLTGTQSGDTIIVRNSTAENIDYIECRFRVFTSDTSNAFGLRLSHNHSISS